MNDYSKVGMSEPISREPRVLGALASLQEVTEKLQQHTGKLFSLYQKVLSNPLPAAMLKAESKASSGNSQLSDMLYEVYAKLDSILESIKELEDRCDV